MKGIKRTGHQKTKMKNQEAVHLLNMARKIREKFKKKNAAGIVKKAFKENEREMKKKSYFDKNFQ